VLAGPTHRHPGASAPTHEHVFRLCAPMAGLPVHPPRTADYQGHTAGGGKKQRSEATRSPAVPREGCEDSRVCLRLPMLVQLVRVRHCPAALSPASSTTRSLLRTSCPSPHSLSPFHAHPAPSRLFFPIPTSPACPPVGIRTYPDPARIAADNGLRAGEKEGEGGRDGSRPDSSAWRNVWTQETRREWGVT
jgi:hypothetical protein